MTDDKRIQTIGLLIKNYRLSEGLSQQELADLCGVHANTLSNIEKGSRGFNIATLLKCIDVLGISIGDFFQGID